MNHLKETQKLESEVYKNMGYCEDEFSILSDIALTNRLFSVGLLPYETAVKIKNQMESDLFVLWWEENVMKGNYISIEGANELKRKFGDIKLY